MHEHSGVFKNSVTVQNDGLGWEFPGGVQGSTQVKVWSKAPKLKTNMLTRVHADRMIMMLTCCFV